MTRSFSKERRSYLSTKVPELRKMGKLRKKIASELRISKSTVDWYLDPERFKQYHKNRSPKQRERRKLRLSSEPYRAYQRNWRRENYLTIIVDGKITRVRVKKRAYSEECEICGAVDQRLHWHHWDPEHLEWGIWTCTSCHRFAEQVEKGYLERGYLEKYFSLKKEHAICPR